MITLLLLALTASQVHCCFSPPRPSPAPTAAPTPPPVSGCRCGTSSANKIVGGTDAVRGEFPWQVALVRCGVMIGLLNFDFDTSESHNIHLHFMM